MTFTYLLTLRFDLDMTSRDLALHLSLYQLTDLIKAGITKHKAIQAYMMNDPQKFGIAPQLPQENHTLSNATRTQKPHNSLRQEDHISTSDNNVPSLPLRLKFLF